MVKDLTKKQVESLIELAIKIFGYDSFTVDSITHRINFINVYDDKLHWFDREIGWNPYQNVHDAYLLLLAIKEYNIGVTIDSSEKEETWDVMLTHDQYREFHSRDKNLSMAIVKAVKKIPNKALK